MKSVLITTYSQLYKEPRVLRQIQALKQDYGIATTGYTQVNDDSIVYHPVKRPEPVKKSFYQKIYMLISLMFGVNNYIQKLLEVNLDIKNMLSQPIASPDVIIAHDWNGLYLASELKKKLGWQAKIYFDAHEYAPKELSAIRWLILVKPLILYVLKRCKDNISAMTTVCEGIAREYEKFFGYPRGFVGVITNAAGYDGALKPAETGRVIRLIHHGGAMEARRLELMVEMMGHLDPGRYELAFMLVRNDPEYYKRLVWLSRKHGNVRFIEPVPFNEIVKTLNGYDIGVYILKPGGSFNNKHALPNKLFEFVQARLAVAVGPSVEMVKVVDGYNLGVHSKDFSPKSLAECIAKLTPEKIMEYKWNAEKHARALSAEENIGRIKQIVAELTGGI